MKQLNQTQEWLSSFHRGDLQPVRDLIEVYFPALQNFSEHIIRENREAREIVTETFIKLLNRRTAFDNHPDIKAFLYITTRNACMDYLRLARNGQPHTAALPGVQDFDLNLVDNNNRIKANQVLLSSLENLPLICQQVFRSIFVEGNTTAAAARNLEIELRELVNYRKQCLRHFQGILSENELYSTAFFVHFLTVTCRSFTPEENAKNLVPSTVGKA